MLEENFRRAMLISRGDLMVFLEGPISAWFIGACALLIAVQIVSYLRKTYVTPNIRETVELLGE